jgi:hypothetical protein
MIEESKAKETNKEINNGKINDTHNHFTKTTNKQTSHKTQTQIIEHEIEHDALETNKTHDPQTTQPPTNTRLIKKRCHVRS